MLERYVGFQTLEIAADPHIEYAQREMAVWREWALMRKSKRMAPVRREPLDREEAKRLVWRVCGKFPQAFGMKMAMRIALEKTKGGSNEQS